MQKIFSRSEQLVKIETLAEKFVRMAQASTQGPSIKQLKESVMILEALNDDWDRSNAKLETDLIKYERDRGVMIRMYFSKPSEPYVWVVIDLFIG